MHAANGPANMAMLRNFAISLSNLLKLQSLPDTFAVMKIYAPDMLTSLKLAG